LSEITAVNLMCYLLHFQAVIVNKLMRGGFNYLLGGIVLVTQSIGILCSPI